MPDLVRRSNAPRARVPAPATLRRYGLTLPEWQWMLKSQGGVCAICGKVPPSRILCVDHEHCRGWKKLPPADRRKTVRGLVCPHCNHRLLGFFVTLERSQAVTTYLTAHAAKKCC